MRGHRTRNSYGGRYTPERALQVGTEEIRTPLGYVLYLTLTTLYRDLPAPRSTPGTEASPEPPLGSDSWHCLSDEQKYLELLGSWYLATEFDTSRAEKSVRFRVPMPMLVVSSAAWDARRAVDTLVQKETAQFDAPDHTTAEVQFVRFLADCLTFMGHLITGTLQAAYVVRLMNACSARTADPGCVLHELLRKEAVILWDALAPSALGERTKPLYQILLEVEELSGVDPRGSTVRTSPQLRGRSLR